MRKSVVYLSAAALVAAASVAASQPQPAAPPPADAAAPAAPKAAATPEDLARGKALFTGACGAYCHQANPAAGPGQGDAPFLFGCEFKHGGSDEEIFQTISHGVANTRMVAFAGAIPDDDIRRIVAYLKSASTCKAPG
jgi:mono/diheme cytochrome c family protein